MTRQHSAQTLIPEDRTFPASTRHGYGLGWLVGRYREHRLVDHGGGIDGFQTECMLLPDDGIGVIAATNTSSSAMAPLAAYAGDYEHPGYGMLSITADGETLRPRLGPLDLSMSHRHYETFDLEWHELGDESHIFPLMFLSDADGDITGLTVPFEPSVDPLRFDRLPDAPGRDPEVLGRLTGTYAMGPVEIVIARQGDHVLTVTAPGLPPLELEPGRGLRFGVTGRPAITIEFEVDDDGAVTRLVARPFGIFLPKS